MLTKQLSAVSTYAALRVALRSVASVASLVATSCRVVALHVAARGCAWLRVAGCAWRWPPCILLVTCPHTLRVALRGVAWRCVENQKYVFTSALVKAR